MNIVICFHLGYAERFAEFTPYIDNVLHCYPETDIIITYREPNFPISNCLQKYPNAKVIFADRGCDTGAFLLQIQHLLKTGKKYDYIFKIHTKTNNEVFKHWKEELLNITSGTSKKVSKVIDMFEKHRKIGIICHKKWIIDVDTKYQHFIDICDRYSLKTEGRFVAGTIFWVRFNIIEIFFRNLNFDKEYGLCELGKPFEPSYTHAWERIFGLIVLQCGYKIYGF